MADPILKVDSTKDNLLDQISDHQERISILETYPNVPDEADSLYYNVKDYGTTGDGSTDDSAAIQACIDSAPNNSTIFFPEGAYVISGAELKVHGGSFKTFTGPGRLRPNGVACFSIEDTAAGDSCEFMRFIGLHIRGYNAETIFDIDAVSGGGGVRQIHIDNCNFWDFLYGVRATVGSGTMHEIIVRNNRITDDDIAGSVGVWMETPDNDISHNIIRGCETGVALDSGAQRLLGNHFFSTPSTTTKCHIAIRRTSGLSGVSHGFVIVGNFVDGDPDDGQIIIDIQYSSSYTIMGNNFLQAAAKGPFIELEAGTGWDVENLTITGNAFVSRTATKTNGFNLATNVQTDDADQFFMHSNTWNAATVYSTGEADRQIGTYAATFVPNPMLGRTIELTLTGNVTIDTPTNPNMGGIGNRLTFVIIQDGTGGRTAGWNAVYKQGWSDTGNTAGLRSTIKFEWDGTNWNQVSAQSPYV